MNDKEGDVNTELIKSLDDIGPGRIVYIRADGIKFLNHLANFRRWMEEKEDDLEQAEMSDSSSKEKLLNQKDGHGVGKLLGSLQPNNSLLSVCIKV